MYALCSDVKSSFLVFTTHYTTHYLGMTQLRTVTQPISVSGLCYCPGCVTVLVVLLFRLCLSWKCYCLGFVFLSCVNGQVVNGQALYGQVMYGQARLCFYLGCVCPGCVTFWVVSVWQIILQNATKAIAGTILPFFFISIIIHFHPY